MKSKKHRSEAEKSQAAQEYLASLNKSSFTTASNHKQQTKPNKSNLSSKTNKNTAKSKTPTISVPTRPKSTNSQKTLQGLQNIFARKPLKTQNITKQISTKSIEKLNDYEIELLNSLAKNELYDSFHQVMKSKNRDRVEYILTVILFPNGAIKNAQISIELQSIYRATSGANY